MYTVEIEGHQVRVSKRDFYERLKRETEWLETGTLAVYISQTNGVPDILGQFKFMVPQIRKALVRIVPQIEDEELRTLFQALYGHAHKILVDINKKLIFVIAKRVGLPLPRTKRQAKILEEKRYNLLYEETPLIDENYRHVLERADEVISEFRATKHRIGVKLAEHLTEIQ